MLYGAERGETMKKQTDAPKKFRVEVAAQRIASIFEALEVAQIRQEWTPEDFIACAIANQIEILRLCGSAEHVDGNLRPQIPVSFPRPVGEACSPTNTKPLARVLRLVSINEA